MSEHYLRFLENEDEAQMTGYKFSVQGDRVIISPTFHHTEYETDRPKNYSKPEARKFWASLISTGKFEEVQPSLSQVLANIATNGGFLTMNDLKVIAKEDRLKMILVRMGNSRFLAHAQDVKWLVEIVQRDGKDYVRDISLPVDSLNSPRSYVQFLPAV